MASPKRVSSRHASDLLDAWVELREVASSGKKGSRHAEMEQAFANVEVRSIVYSEKCFVHAHADAPAGNGWCGFKCAADIGG